MNQNDFGILCVCALRYCMGRRTYMPSLIIQICKAHLKEFSDKDLGVMLEDISFREKMSLGDECDIKDWMRWKEAIEEEMKKRANS